MTGAIIGAVVYLLLAWQATKQWEPIVDGSSVFYRHTKNAPSWGGAMVVMVLLIPGMLVIGALKLIVAVVKERTS
jgi:hypothetical protein